MKGIPQIIVIALYAMSVGITLAEVADGKRTGKDMFYRILGTAVMIGLLWCGGFFT